MPKYYVEVAPDATYWYKDAKMEYLHRAGGPAIECANGTREWYRNGKLHREDGPAIEYANGAKWWYQDGKLHREGGPAVDRIDGPRMWYRNGILHREDGPAIEYISGKKEWWVNGKRLTKEAFTRRTKSVVELTVAEIERLLGKRVKIVK